MNGLGQSSLSSFINSGALYNSQKVSMACCVLGIARASSFGFFLDQGRNEGSRKHVNLVKTIPRINAICLFYYITTVVNLENNILFSRNILLLS